MKPRISRYLGIALLTIGIIGTTVVSLNDSGGFLADPGAYPNRPGGPPWGNQFGPYSMPDGWQDPQNLYNQEQPQNGEETPNQPVPGPYWNQQPNLEDQPGQEDQFYESNGESIYYRLETLDGEPILAQARNMGRSNLDLSCSGCHGNAGDGGYLEMGPGSMVIPAINWETLTTNLGGGELLRPAYTEAKLGQAITQGIDSAGRRLNYAMPRFQLEGNNLSDLISFLKTL